MKKSLFTKRYRYSKDAHKLKDKIGYVAAKLMSEFVNQGYAPQEIAHVMTNTITEIEWVSISDK